MTNNTGSQQLKDAISKLANEFKPLLADIHNQDANTKNYYGDYLSILSQFADNKGKLKLIALSLMYAGANVEGVEAAVKILQ